MSINSLVSVFAAYCSRIFSVDLHYVASYFQVSLRRHIKESFAYLKSFPSGCVWKNPVLCKGHVTFCRQLEVSLVLRYPSLFSVEAEPQWQA